MTVYALQVVSEKFFMSFEKYGFCFAILRKCMSTKDAQKKFLLFGRNRYDNKGNYDVRIRPGSII